MEDTLVDMSASDLQTDAVLRVPQNGLQDRQSANTVCVSFFRCLCLTKSQTIFRSATRPFGFILLSHVLQPRIDHPVGQFRTNADRGKVFSQGRKDSPLHQLQSRGPVDDDELGEEVEEVCKAVLEFVISFSEAKHTMVHCVDEWVSAIVRGCLRGMGELRDDELARMQTCVCRSPSGEHKFTCSFLAWNIPQMTHIPRVYEQSLGGTCRRRGRIVEEQTSLFQHQYSRAVVLPSCYP